MLNQDTQLAIAFGKKLRDTRKSYTTTQTELAKHLGIATSSVCLMEKGRKPVTPKILEGINKFYGTKLRYPKSVPIITKGDASKIKTNLIAFLETTLAQVKAL